MFLEDFWDSKISRSQIPSCEWNTKEYHNILCGEYPSFLDEYIELPILKRLSGVGLLCGSDWTKLFKNGFYYSRLDHSIGAALIVWNFTHSKAQTLAALFHDVSTPAFSHVSDFRNGDSLTQESTEHLNKTMVDGDADLALLLKRDGLSFSDVDDYHKYPVADNDRPMLSADRLEYMYPSGAALTGAWTLREIQKNFSAIRVLKNERGVDELGFIDEEQAVLYTNKFCSISHLLQRNEDKAALQLLAEVLSEAFKQKIFCEDDLYSFDEEHIIKCIKEFSVEHKDSLLARLFFTFTDMTHVIHSEKKLDGCWCVNLNVKTRYVDPLVKTGGGKAERVSKINSSAKKTIDEFLLWKDSAFGCVPYCVF